MAIAVAFTGTSLLTPLPARAQLADIAGIAAVCALAPVSKVAITFVSEAITGVLADLFAWLPTSIGAGASQVKQTVAVTKQLAAMAGQVVATSAAAAAALVADAAVITSAELAATISVPVADPSATAATAAAAAAVAAVSLGQEWKSLQDWGESLQAIALAKEKLIKDNTEANNSNLADCIIYGAGQLMLNQLTDNIISWIQGGFNGSPSFAIDTHALFLDLADSVAGDLAAEIRGIMSCNFTPTWNNDLANSVDNSSRKYARNRFTTACPFDLNFTASTFFDGAQNAFLRGGGMKSFEASLDDLGNPFGLRIVVSKELQTRQDETRRIQEQKLSWSNGFIDLVDTNNCNYPASVAAGMKDFPPEAVKIYQRTYCQTTTPGKIIEGQLTKVTGLDMDRLGVSDSLNKIVSAFMKQITKQVKSGIFNAIASSSNKAKTKVVPNETTPPTVPQNVTVVYVSTNQINVSWTASYDQSGVFAYYVRRNGNEKVVSVLSGPTQYIDSSPFIAGKSYTYTVSAFDTLGNESAQSAGVLAPAQTGTTCPVGTIGVPPSCIPCPAGGCSINPDGSASATTPTVPQKVTVLYVSQNQINVSWSASSGGSGMLAYYVRRNGNEKVVSVLSGDTQYIDSGPFIAGKSYTYTVSAFDTLGNESALSSAKTVVANDTTAPTVPQNVTAVLVSPNQIRVSWSASSDQSGVYAYYVRRNGNERVVSLAFLGTSFADIYSFIPTTTYSYTVSAVDIRGNESALSSSATVTVPASE